MTFLVGVTRDRRTVVIYHTTTKARFDVLPGHALDLSIDDGESYALTNDETSVGVTEGDVVALRRDVKNVLRYVDVAA